jgi:hypothetical protein
LQKIISENSKIEKKLFKNSGNVLTNDRRTYYEDQGIDNLKWWRYLFLSFYIIVVIAYVILFFIAPSNYSSFKKIGILILFIIYPFAAPYIFYFVVDIVKRILALLPKNAYLHI